MLRLKVLFFGQLKDIAGRSEDSVELPEGSRVEDVFAHYASAHPRLRELAGSIVVARNQQFTPGTQSVADGDEIAFLPPVSGGSGAYTHQIESEGGHFFALTRGWSMHAPEAFLDNLAVAQIQTPANTLNPSIT